MQSWRDWCWSWNSNTLANWCEELTHLKRPWFWERLRAGGEGDNGGWGGWMASPTQWTWVWVDSGSWWWTGRPGVLQSMGLQRVRHDWATELNWRKDHGTWNVTSYLQNIYGLWIKHRTGASLPIHNWAKKSAISTVKLKLVQRNKQVLNFHCQISLF